MSIENMYNIDVSERYEEGAVVMYNGPDPSLGNHAWGVVYADGQSTSYGWCPMVDTEKVKLSNPKYLTKPEDETYQGSHYIPELKKNGKVVKIRRTTTVEVL